MYSQEEEWLLRDKYRGEKSAAFFADVTALEAGTPLAYLIGHIPFLDTTIYLNSHPLIPRPETEFWVEKVITIINGPAPFNKKTALHILDLCAGSGAIGVAIAKHVPGSEITFIELCSDHLPTIARNCRENGIAASRVSILAGDLFNTSKPLPRFDFILSNPPYIDAALGRTENSVIEHEPELALWGGVAGMDTIALIIKNSPQFLNPGGQLWLEHEPEQVEAIDTLAKNHFNVYHHLDQYRTPRFTQLVLK